MSQAALEKKNARLEQEALKRQAACSNPWTKRKVWFSMILVSVSVSMHVAHGKKLLEVGLLQGVSGKL